MGILDIFRPKAPALPPAPEKKRADGWINEALGLGTYRDKIAGGYVGRTARLADEEIRALYYSDDVAARIVDDKPKEMLRAGYEIEDDSELEDRLREIRADEKLLDAMRWGRAFGGALLIVGANDGGDPSLPLIVERVTGVSFLNVIDRRYVYVEARNNDPLSPDFGAPLLYRIQPAGGGSSLVHASRTIRFDGIPVDAQTATELQGWTYSVLQRPYEEIRRFATAMASAGFLLSDAAQGVFKIQGLIDMIASGEKAALQTRMAMVDMYRGAGRAILLDAEMEEFLRVGTPLAGIPELVDRLMMRVAAAADMPVTRLMGRSPAGLNATGESDMRGWYDQLASEQKKVLEPAIRRLCEILTAGSFDGEIEFCPLWEPTEKEKAEVEQIEANTWKTYVDMGAVMPEHVALAEFADIPVEVDVSALQEAIKEPPPPAPTDPNAAPPEENQPPDPNAPPTAPTEPADDGEDR